MPFTFKLSRRLARIRRRTLRAAAALLAGVVLGSKAVGSAPTGHAVVVPENLALSLAQPQPVIPWVENPVAATNARVPTTPYDGSVS